MCSACAEEAVPLDDPVQGELAGQSTAGGAGVERGRTGRAEVEEKRRKEDTEDVRKEEGHLVLLFLKTSQEPHGKIQAPQPGHKPHTVG